MNLSMKIILDFLKDKNKLLKLTISLLKLTLNTKRLEI